MSASDFRIQGVTFSYEVTKQYENAWLATLKHIQEGSTQEELRALTGSGHSPDSAAEDLERKVRQVFTISIQQFGLKEILGGFFSWVWSGASKKQRTIRAILALLSLGIVSIFFVDFSHGSSPISNNVRWLSSMILRHDVELKDEGFFDDKFFADALQSSQKRFWASGVSFRNLVRDNKKHLEDFLDRGGEFRLVLLDPNSCLAGDAYMATFSKTARKQDIESTIERLTSQEGVLTQRGNRGTQQVWISPYAPIVPMVVVDDQIFASFLLHVDTKTNESSYHAPYLRIPADSPLGQRLLKHFQNMLNNAKEVPPHV